MAVPVHKSIRDAFKLLGLDEDATEREVKIAYKRLVLKFHPDRGGDKEKFQQLGQAHKSLTEYFVLESKVPIESIVASIDLAVTELNNLAQQKSITEDEIKDALNVYDAAYRQFDDLTSDDMTDLQVMEELKFSFKSWLDVSRKLENKFMDQSFDSLVVAREPLLVKYPEESMNEVRPHARSYN